MAMTRRRKTRWAGAALLALLLLPSCSSKKHGPVTYHDPNMDFSLVQSVAVLPFENLTNDSNAAGRVRDSFMIMLQATGALYVIPPGEVNRGVLRAGVGNPAEPTTEEITSVAKIISADAVITGTLREYGQARSGSASANIVSLSVEMIEAQTGRVVWSGSSTKGGVSTANRVFGGGGRPMDVVTAKAIDDLLDQLFE
jgi:hypothetical protein